MEPAHGFGVAARSDKPRTRGLTMVNDVSTTRAELASILDDHGAFIDFAKFGVGTADVAPYLTEKIALYKSAGVVPYFGGTLFEKYYTSDLLDEYTTRLASLGIEIIEISCGTASIPLEERLELVDRLGKDFRIVAEVGSKDQEHVMSPSLWVNELKSLLDAGADYVIAEGRDSATAGLYRPSGELREGLLEEIGLNLDVDRVVFEAPTASAQMYMINRFGPEVNIGNVRPSDVLLLETERRGLRFETFWI